MKFLFNVIFVFSLLVDSTLQAQTEKYFAEALRAQELANQARREADNWNNLAACVVFGFLILIFTANRLKKKSTVLFFLLVTSFLLVAPDLQANQHSDEMAAEVLLLVTHPTNRPRVLANMPENVRPYVPEPWKSAQDASHARHQVENTKFFLLSFGLALFVMFGAPAIHFYLTSYHPKDSKR